MLRIGIDLGGTKIEIIALNDDGLELARRRIPTPQGDYTATLMAVATLVEETEGHLGQRGTVGIGIPGAESLATGLIKNANSTCLIGRPLKETCKHYCNVTYASPTTRTVLRCRKRLMAADRLPRPSLASYWEPALAVAS
jgi:predicted NBD/HSP70 family sugar kinase